jgi:hypothetical protein
LRAFYIPISLHEIERVYLRLQKKNEAVPRQNEWFSGELSGWIGQPRALRMVLPLNIISHSAKVFLVPVINQR